MVPKLPSIYDEPFADSSQIPTFLVSEMTRQHVTVALSGDGGDELFAGYNRYGQGLRVARALRVLPRPVASCSRAPNRRRAAVDVGPIVRRGARGHAAAACRARSCKSSPSVLGDDASGYYRSLIAQWADAWSLVKGATPFDQPAFGDATRARFKDELSWMQYADSVTYLPDDILTKVDRASMAVSLEARVPLLDHRVAAFAWHLPARLKMRGGQGKWLLRQVLYKYVPKALVERPKMGFGVPIDAWLRGPLKDWAADLLDPAAMTRAGLLDPAPIQEKWAEHQSGKRNWQHFLWNVLMFEAWRRTLARDCPVVGEQSLVKRTILIDGLLEREFGRRAVPRTLTHGAAARGVFSERQDRGAKRAWVMRRDDEARLAIEDGFGIAADIGDHHGQTRRHELQHRVGEALVAGRREDAEVGCRQEEGHVASLAEQADILAEPRLRDGVFDAGAAAAVAAGAQHHPRLRHSVGNLGERRNEIQMTLIGEEIGHRRGDEGLRIEAERLAGFGSVHGGVRRPHAVIDEMNFGFGAAFPQQLVRHGLGVAEQGIHAGVQQALGRSGARPLGLVVRHAAAAHELDGHTRGDGHGGARKIRPRQIEVHDGRSEALDEGEELRRTADACEAGASKERLRWPSSGAA